MVEWLGVGRPLGRAIFLNFQVKVQGFMHFLPKTVLVARNLDQGGGFIDSPGG